MQKIEELHQQLKARGLERLIPHTAALVAPAIRLLLEPWPSHPLRSTRYPNDETPLGCSKVGGLPDLPFDFVWPESESCALPFLAQLRLSEVGVHDLDSDLPSSGLLTFFYDAYAHYLESNPQDFCRVFHIENDSTLERRLFPDNIRQWESGNGMTFEQPIQHRGIFEQPLFIKFHRELQVADDDALEFEAVAQALTLSKKEREVWWQLSLDWSEQNEKIAYEEIAKRKLGYQEHPYHQLLGLPYCGNFDGRAEVIGLEEETEPIDWRLLFQLSSNDGLEWGDNDNISFFIQRDALLKRDFTDIRVSIDG